ncbi:hypothetical protein AFB00_21615 [Pseudonocardia sp. HH130630-07]|nr:hypothetical protein AFB00_21615 [Pseudonocardia sp. HH130630-07]
MRGLSSWMRSQPMPIASSVPGRKFSTTTSLRATRPSRIAVASGCRVSSVIPCLFRLNIIV